MEHAYSTGEVIVTILGIALTCSFGLWAGVVRSAAKAMEHQIGQAISELKQLREEIHKDRLLNERRFARLEQHTGLRGDE